MKATIRKIKNNKPVFIKYPNGMRRIYHYNDNGQLMYTKSPSGLETWYDDRRNIIHTRKSDENRERYYEYDSSNNIIRCYNSSGMEILKHYNSKNLLVHEEHIDNSQSQRSSYQYWYVYTEDDRLWYSIDSFGNRAIYNQKI